MQPCRCLCCVAVVILLALVSGCRTPRSQILRENDYIPLKDLALVRLVEPEKGDLARARSGGLVGSVQMLEPPYGRFDDSEETWAWPAVANVAGLNFDLALDRGLDTVKQKLGADLKIEAKEQRLGDATFQIGAKDEFRWTNLWHVRIDSDRVDEARFNQQFYETFVPKQIPRGRKLHFGLVTEALVAEIDESSSAGFKLTVNGVVEQRVDVKAKVSGSAENRVQGRGLALGAKGQLFTVTAGSGWHAGAKAIPANGTVEVTIDGATLSATLAGDELKLGIRPGNMAFFTGSSGKWKAGDGTLKLEKGAQQAMLADNSRVFAVYVRRDDNGNVFLTDCWNYDIQRERLDYPRFQKLATEVPMEAETDLSKEAWDKELDLLDTQARRTEFLDHQRELLSRKAGADDASFQSCDVADVLVPDASNPGRHHFARVIRLGMNKQVGRMFRYRAFRTGGTNPLPGRLMMQKADGSLALVHPGEKAAYADSSSEVRISEDMEYLILRYSSSEPTYRVDMSGFGLAWSYGIDNLHWSCGFVGPLGASCNFVFGDRTPELAKPGTETAAMPAWVLPALQQFANDDEPDLAKVLEGLKRHGSLAAGGIGKSKDVRLFELSRPNPGRKIGWLVYSANSQ